MSINTLSRRRMLTSFIAAFTAAAGFASSSCAAPRWPPTGGYPLRSYAAGYELQVLLDGMPAPTYQHAGETYVQGQMGARYTLRVVNHTGRRIEAVVSVDGRDAIDGKAADVRNKRGYLVPGWGTVDIDGWRLSRAEVAAFRFSSVADSYAARTGNAREVGVIGVAVFPERIVQPPRPIYAPPRYPRYQPPHWPRWRDEGRGGPGASPPDDYYGSLGESERKADASKKGSKSSGAPSADASSPASPPPSASRSAEAQAEMGPSPRHRPGLGTEFGEAVNSPVHEVNFARANSSTPSVILGARYNDRDGLLALGIHLDGYYPGPDDLAWRQSATPFPASDNRYARPPSGWQQGCCVSY